MEISFTDRGSGFPVVLIHGFCETRQIWNGLADDLSKIYRVLTPDLPGFGDSPLPEDDFKLADIAEMISGWLRALDVEEAVVIGHSLGGYVTLALAERQPAILKGFGLFHSTAFADSNEKQAVRDKTIDFVIKQGVSVFANSFIPQLFYDSNNTEIDPVIRIAAATQQDSVIAYTKTMRDRKDRTDVLKTFDRPVLIIGGDKDKILPADNVAALKSLSKNPAAHIFENTGHMGMIEQKLLSFKVVRDFVDLCEKDSL